MTYLDAASAAPLHPVARETLAAALDAGWADPARLYREGRAARALLDSARASVAAALGARPDEVAFAPSGTVAVHLAVLGGLAGRRRVGSRFVCSAVEHSSVLAAGAHADAEVVEVPVDRAGRVEAGAFVAACSDGTALASLMSANHEVGTLQPVAEVAGLLAERGVPLHVDAAQSVGRVPFDAGAAALVTASGHKWGGPPGVGVLVVRKGTRWRSPLPVDEREAGRMPGYENLPAVLAAAASLEARLGELADEAARLSPLVDRIRARVAAEVPDVQVVGSATERLPHLVTFSCLYVDGEALLTELDRRGFSVSSGSACSASTLRPSHVLAAMGVLTHGNVRVSLHRDTTAEDVERFLAELPSAVAAVRERAGVSSL